MKFNADIPPKIPKKQDSLEKEDDVSLKIDFRGLSKDEQHYFINFLFNFSKNFGANKEMKQIKDFAKKYKKEGFRTFLSIEKEGKEMGNKIIGLGEKLPKETAKKVFAKYGEIIDSANTAEEEVKKLYEKENIPDKVFESIRETLLKRGAELLSGLADKDSNINEQEILQQLEDIKTQTIIMGSSYIELYKQNIKIPVEDISNTSLEKISAQNLTEKEKQELLNTYEKGRPKETYENEEHIKLLKNEFKETLENESTFVFNVRFNGEIIAFATFNKESDDTLHIGGLTFLEDVRNPAVAQAVMNSIMNEFGDFNIKALVHSKNKILNMYQNRFGFKITKELPKEENAGELYYEIERSKNKEYKIAA